MSLLSCGRPLFSENIVSRALRVECRESSDLRHAEIAPIGRSSNGIRRRGGLDY